MRNLRCFFGFHDTQIVIHGDQGVIRCKRCQQTIGKTWKILRPEQQIQAEKTHAEIMADRERRATEMSAPKQAKVAAFRYR